MHVSYTVKDEYTVAIEVKDVVEENHEKLCRRKGSMLVEIHNLEELLEEKRAQLRLVEEMLAKVKPRPAAEASP